MVQHYSANAVTTKITAGISNTDNALTLDDPTGWPTTNFVATLERDTVREEQVFITNRSGVSCTGVARGFGSTTGVNHSSGAPIHHTSDALSMQRWEDHLSVAGAHTAANVSNTPAGNIAATTVQAALNELDAEKAPLAEPVATAHMANPAGAHAASAVTFAPTGTIGATTVQGAIAEVASEAAPAAEPVAATHIANANAAHAASAISFAPAGSIAANTVQAAILEAAAEAVALARQIISGAGLVGGGDLSADRTLAVGAGVGIIVNADDVALDPARMDMGPANTTWTPTWFGTNANVGNATVSKRWYRQGRMITFWYSAVFGSSTVMAAVGSALAIALPVPAANPGGVRMAIGSAFYDDAAGNATYAGSVWIDHFNAQDRFFLGASIKGVSNFPVNFGLDANTPFAWSANSNSRLSVFGSYEAAS